MNIDNNLIAKASVEINSPIEKVWNALTDPKAVKEYMMGADLSTDWKPGSAVSFKGEFNGKPFEEKGTVLIAEPNKKLSYKVLSSSEGKEDLPENYHTITVQLEQKEDKVLLQLEQDNNADEKMQASSAKNWQIMMEGLKKVAEES